MVYTPHSLFRGELVVTLTSKTVVQCCVNARAGDGFEEDNARLFERGFQTGLHWRCCELCIG